MKYELKYEDFSKGPVLPSSGDILVLVHQDGHKEIFHACDNPDDTYRCDACDIALRSGRRGALSCDHWGFICIAKGGVTYKSIDTLLEDL